MNPIYIVCTMSLMCGLANSYPTFGIGRVQRSGAMAPLYPPQTAQQYYEQNMPQYLSVPSYPQPLQRVYDEYNNRQNYYYYPREEYHSFGMPTYRGEYKPTPYYYARPSFSLDEEERLQRLEQSNPLDDLHEEIQQEHELERARALLQKGQFQDQSGWYPRQVQPQAQPVSSSNYVEDDNANSEFMRNLVMYNKQLDSLDNRETYDNNNNIDDYEEEYVEDPTWYDTTSIQVERPYNYNNEEEMPNQPMLTYQTQPHQQQQPLMKPASSDYDEEVKELKELAASKNHQYVPPAFPGNNNNWQQDANYESQSDYDDDDWINWDRKRSIQPKKDMGIFSLSEKKLPATNNKLNNIFASQTTKKPEVKASTTEKPKIVAKPHTGQKEVVLPRPANPVRRPFTEPVMKMLENESKAKAKKSNTQPIYGTIKQIIDMEENLSHVSRNTLTPFNLWFSVKLAFTSPCPASRNAYKRIKNSQ